MLCGSDANLEAYPQMKPANTPQRSAIERFSRFLHLDIPEVWVRFLLALVGLILAFAAALFSTVARESGTSGPRWYWPRSRWCWRSS